MNCLVRFKDVKMNQWVGSTKFCQSGIGSRTIKSLNLFRTIFYKSRRKIIFKSVPKLISYFFSFRLEKYNFLQKNPKTWFNSAFPLILYLWTRMSLKFKCPKIISFWDYNLKKNRGGGMVEWSKCTLYSPGFLLR